MQKLLTSLIIVGLLASCSLKTDKLAKDSNLVKPNVDSVNNRKAIDAQMAKGDRPDDQQETPSYAEERRNLIKQYDEVKLIDTTLIRSNDTLHLHLKYYCLKKIKLIIPNRYSFDNDPQDFVTHPFASDIVLTHNGDTIFNRTITKSSFDTILYPQLKQYAVIMMPNLSSSNRDKNSIILDYSISIPITDVGIGASLIINKNGDHKIAK